MKLEGPKEKTPEAHAIARTFGFSYRNLLGEMVYAYVVCRVDIGFAVCFLSRFSDAPHSEHFTALKNLCRYLRSTKDWGIIFWRPAPLAGLPSVPFNYAREEDDIPDFPEFAIDELYALLDAAHATDLKSRRSVTGLAVMFCNAVIAYKSKLQDTVATSSTEAEFLAAVLTAKDHQVPAFRAQGTRSLARQSKQADGGQQGRDRHDQ